MEFERRSSGVAKGGLATGIVGTSLGTLALLGGGAGALANWGRGNSTPNVVIEQVPAFGMNYGMGGCCSENTPVNRYELSLQQKIAEKDAAIALRDANTYNDQKTLQLYQYVDGRLRDIESKLCAQEVQNQATKDSFQLVSERIDCCCKELRNDICNEAKERRCNDNTLVNYMNATFYAKQVANVTTGTTTTAQGLFNPLPAQTCCGCCNN